MLRFCCLLLLSVFLLPLAASADRSGVLRLDWVDDIEVTLSSMEIDEVELDSQRRYPVFERDQVSLKLGSGRSTFGLVFRDTSKSTATPPGEPESGLMLTVSRDWLLSGQFRLFAEARVGLTGTNEYQPLYSEDTDLQANFVWFDADGIGFSQAFPSAYGGLIVNRFGRFQVIGGVGLWWNRIGLYATGFHALNGDDPQFNGVDFGRVNFAALENSGASLSLSYEWRGFLVGVKRNFALKNGGNDLSIFLTLRHRIARSIIP